MQLQRPATIAPQCQYTVVDKRGAAWTAGVTRQLRQTRPA